MVFDILSKRFRNLAVVLLFLIVLVVGGCSSPSTNTPVSATGSADTSCLSSVEAMNSVGKTACVEYFVGNASQFQGIVYLNEKADYKKGFGAVILNDSLAKFDDPVNQFRNKNVRVNGLIVEYDGHPGIILNSPSDITVK